MTWRAISAWPYHQELEHEGLVELLRVRQVPRMYDAFATKALNDWRWVSDGDGYRTYVGIKRRWVYNGGGPAAPMAVENAATLRVVGGAPVHYEHTVRTSPVAEEKAAKSRVVASMSSMANRATYQGLMVYACGTKLVLAMGGFKLS
jgi:hypothetical protein